MKIKPGQIWEEIKDEGLVFAYLICSTDEKFEGEDLWMCKVFQDWGMGAYNRELTESDMKRFGMEYKGHIKELK